MLLRLVEMDDAESLMPGELSGGMLKRAGIARAMALGCDILLLDEPSAGPGSRSPPPTWTGRYSRCAEIWASPSWW